MRKRATEEQFTRVAEPPLPECDRCPSPARWSICNLEGDAMDPIVRWLACGRHLHGVLDKAGWELDCVQLYDLQHVTP